ncbi:DUF4124 domain-containing protein [Acinetobacter sp. NIPH 2100]|uniref:DUF4124 domain-containing protein n=1 Tax=Acinetobacter sp. NIPH 2100 TaxID=1217708 RepID=UPI0002D09EFE|nr:DUF4124 domain-containing protein [Acinetobacter sp. NIPH 2100]ENX44649.1 hypothetical protein F887_00590 [Acinetobacter sp. NIPH 2100]
MKSSYLKTSLYIISTTALLLCSSQNYAQQYYKWVDANGSTHYTTTPPPKGTKRLDKVSTYGNNRQTTNPSHQTNQAAPEATPNTQQHIPQAAPEAPANSVKPESLAPTSQSNR